MRPINLQEVASSVVRGMSRSINRSAQPTEDQTHEESREGSAIQSLSGSERQQLYNLIDQRLKSEGKEWDYVYTVTGKDYEDSAYSAFADMPENADWIRELILEISRDRNGCSECEDREGSRNGSRKGMDVDGYFNVVAGNHGLDIAKAIKVRDEMNEEGILPDTEEFVELSKKHGVDPDIMQNVVDDLAERYLM